MSETAETSNIRPEGVTHGTWNKNPGNIKGYRPDGSKTDITKWLDKQGINYSKGTDASDGGSFLKFENNEDGLKLADNFWNIVKTWAPYRGKTVKEALSTYAADGYNEKFLNNLTAKGIDVNAKLDSLDATQLSSITHHQMQTEDPNQYKELQKEGLVTKDGKSNYKGAPKVDSDENTPESDPGAYNPLVGDDYVKPKSPQQIKEDDINKSVTLIGEARSFWSAHNNTTLNKAEKAEVEQALMDYTSEFGAKLPKSSFGNRDKNLGKEGTGFHKEYSDGVLAVTNELIRDIDISTPDGWGKVSAIRRQIAHLSSSEDFAIKVLGDKAGNYGKMDSSLEYIIQARDNSSIFHKDFDWGFGTYGDDDKALDHYKIPANLREKLESDTYVQKWSEEVDHPNEMFDADDKDPLFKAPIFTLNPRDVAKAVAFDIQENPYYHKNQKEVRDGIYDKIHNYQKPTVIKATEVAKLEVPALDLDVKPSTPTSLVSDPEVDEDADVEDDVVIEEISVDPEDPEDTTPIVEDATSTEDDRPVYNESFMDKIGGVSSLIGLATGAMGMAEAMKEIDIPKDPRLGAAFQQRLEESKIMANQGLTPSELAQAHKELDSSYSTGIENLVRGTAGSRANFLAGLGGMDAARQSALVELSVKDAEMRRANQGKYDEMMIMNETHNAQREANYANQRYQAEVANKQSGAQLAAAGIGMVNESIGDRKLNQLRKVQTNKMLEDMGYKTNSDKEKKFDLKGKFEEVKDWWKNSRGTGLTADSRIEDVQSGLLGAVEGESDELQENVNNNVMPNEEQLTALLTLGKNPYGK